MEVEGNEKKRKMKKRINEWERFEVNCSKIRDLETENDSLHPEIETREQINQKIQAGAEPCQALNSNCLCLCMCVSVWSLF